MMHCIKRAEGERMKDEMKLYATYFAIGVIAVGAVFLFGI
jgi:hypothetical protein